MVTRNEVSGDDREREQRRKSHPAGEREIEKRSEWLALLRFDALRDPRVKSRRGLHRFFRAQRTEKRRDFLKGSDLFAAGRAPSEVRLNRFTFCRFQRSGKKLFEAFHYYRVHMLL